jgi:hypothetical protein
LNGRVLYERALNVVAMCKKAEKFHDEFVKSNGENPSGTSLEDMLLYVRQKMYVQLKGARSSKANQKPKKTEEVITEEDMPEKWMFNGWFAFVLYGPQGVSTKSLSVLSKDGKNVPKQSRAETRAKEAQVNEAKRRNERSGERGTSTMDQMAMATLKHSELKEETANIRELMFLANSDETNTLNALKLTCQMLASAESEEEMRYHRRRKSELFKRLEEIGVRKKHLEEESDRLRQESSERKKAATTASLEVVETPQHPPRQVSITTGGNATSSISHSGSTSRTKASNPNASVATACSNNKRNHVDLMNHGGSDDDNEENVMNQNHGADNDDEEEDDDDTSALAGEYDDDSRADKRPRFQRQPTKSFASTIDLESIESSVPESVPINKSSERRICPVEASLDDNSKKVLEDYRKKQAEARANNFLGNPYGMEYLEDKY